jgi:hypothetical protein
MAHFCFMQAPFCDAAVAKSPIIEQHCSVPLWSISLLYIYCCPFSNSGNSIADNQSMQGVIKRCRPSWLTNSALVYEPKYGGEELRGLSCVHHVTWSPNKLWRSNSITNESMLGLFPAQTFFPTILFILISFPTACRSRAKGLPHNNCLI